ncbi:MAG: hypothetical protein HY541_01970 [Deltaproteobacteria bacterium]|nr:hypothetical protein [Deltaproteobacteria bacterium]
MLSDNGKETSPTSSPAESPTEDTGEAAGEENVGSGEAASAEEAGSAVEGAEVSGETADSKTTSETTTDATSTITAKYFGSYVGKIKVSGEIPSDDDDIPAIVSAVSEAKQNLYGYAAHDGALGDDTKGFYWPNFLELLKETKNMETKVFAVLGEKHFETGNRWNYDWAAAGADLGTLSAAYPNLAGFNVDDFGGYDCSEDTTQLEKTCYAASDIKKMTDAGKTANANFKFWPTIYFYQIPRTICPSYILGSEYGVQMTKEEYGAVKLTFSLDTAPATAVLSFLYTDTETGEDAVNAHEFKGVEVNGNSLVNATLAGNQYVERFSDDIAKYLKAGENEIVFKMYVDSPVNIYHRKLVYFWDIKLAVDGKEVADWKETFDKHESDSSYPNHKALMINNKGRIIAKSNKNYLIADSIDGLFVPLTHNQSFYSAETYKELLSSTKACLGDKDLMAVLYGEMWGYDIKPEVLKEQIEVAAGIADGVVIWNYPLAMGAAAKGIFSQKKSYKSGYAIRSYWPSYQLGVEGYYQRWITKKELTGTVTVKITDSMTGDAGVDYFVKKVEAVGTTYYEDGIPGDEGEEAVSVALGETPAYLVLSVVETEGVGNMSASVFFNVTGADGKELTADDFDFKSSTTHTQSQDNYEAVRDAFSSLQKKNR